MNVWEIILEAAFSTIGTIEYAKGFAKKAPSLVWRIIQPVVCLGYAAAFQYLPEWVRIGIMALSLSQVGYEAIIGAVKKRIETKHVAS